MTDMRPVWLTKHQRNAFAVLGHTNLVSEWDAMPEDIFERIRQECWTALDGFVSERHSDAVADAVLRVLRAPGT